MQWVNRVLIAILLACAVAYLPHTLYRSEAAGDLQRLVQEQQELTQENLKLQQEIIDLQAEVTALKQDPHELERIAREDLNMTFADEVVFEIVDAMRAP